MISGEFRVFLIALGLLPCINSEFHPCFLLIGRNEDKLFLLLITALIFPHENIVKHIFAKNKYTCMLRDRRF
jgi:hypothetical protein